MQQKRYLDTNLYLYLCETDNSKHSCHPNKKEAQIITSYLACEEALYIYINKESKGTFVKEYDDISDLINKLNEFNKKIKIADDNLSGIYGKSQEIIDNLIRSKIELKKSRIHLKQKNRLLNAMDIFHLAYADSEGCQEFATTDRGFSVLERLSKNYSIQNIKQILIYDSNKLENDKKVSIVNVPDYSNKTLE